MEKNFENEGLINLMKRITEEPSLVEKFSNIENRNIDNMYNTALSIAEGYTKEEFTEFLKCLQNIQQKRTPANPSEQLNEDALDKVSGGSKFGKFLEDTCEFLDAGGIGILQMFTNL